MVGNDENIYVEFDYQNCVLIDPNKVIDSLGNIKERAVKNENLIMYANLECSLLPRTRLALGIDNNVNRNLVSVATVNFLNPSKDGFLNDEFYNEITGLDSIKGGGTNQVKEVSTENKTSFVRQVINNIDTGLLGITDISIDTRVNGFFEITIMMEDYHGRALFEKGEESPYACFFTYPYPIFYLTVKGYYGKAVKHSLHLKTFSANYSPESGNFKITTKFQTYQYSCLQNLPIQHIMVLPYMFESKINITPPANNATQDVQVKTVPVTRGLQKIRQVYTEYKSKGLLSDNFPEITISQFIAKLNTLEKNLLNWITQQDLSPIDDYSNYLFYLENYQKRVFTGQNSFFNNYLDRNNFYVLDGNKQNIYTFKKETVESKNSQKAITELKASIDEFNKKLKENKTFGFGGSNSINNPITYEIINIVNPQINYEETFKKRFSKKPTDDPDAFEKFKLQLDQIFLSKNSQTNESYWFRFDEDDKSFMTITENMTKELNTKFQKIESDYQDKLTNLLKSTDNGLGFEPTLKNLFTILMANTEAFLRLMCDTHELAWAKRNDQIRMGVIQDKNKTVTSPDLKDYVDIGGENLIPVYPWPLFFVESNTPNSEKYILQYIGDPKHSSRTKSYLTEIWPEVEFVEEYMRATAKRSDNSINFDAPEFSNPNQNIDRISLNSLDFPTTNTFFSNKQEVKFLYEIWERVFISSFYQRFGKKQTQSLLPQIIAENETLNIKNAVGLDTPYLIQKLKQFDLTSSNYINYLANISNRGLGDSWQKYIRDIFVTNYIDNEVFKNFEILDQSSIDPNKGKVNPQPTKLRELSDYLTKSNSNFFEFVDTYPFVITEWFKDGLANGRNNTDYLNTFNTTKTLMLNDDKKVISNFNTTTSVTQIRPITNFNYLDPNLKLPEPTEDTFNGKNFNTFYKNRIEKEGIKKQLPTEGGVFYRIYNGNLTENQTTSLINTPYFTNAILEGVNRFTSGNEFPYVSAAYLFLNSLPVATLREKYKTYENNTTTELDYIFASLKKFGGVHKVPYAWILKYGSIWHRYKVWKQTGVDILDNCWKNFDAKENYDPITKSDSKEYNLNLNGISENIVLQKTTPIVGDDVVEINVGFYPKVINDFNIFCRGFGLFTNYDDNEIQNAVNSSGDSIDIVYTDQSSFNKNKRYNKSNLSELLRYRTWSCSLNDKKNNQRFIVPSFGSNINQVEFECFDDNGKLKIPVYNNSAAFNGSVRGVWGLPHYGYFDNTQLDKFTPEMYPKTIYTREQQQESFSLNVLSDYSSIEEIFSVFDRQALDKMEVEFLNYSRSMYDIQIIKSGDTTISVIDITKLKIDPNKKEKNFQLMMVDLLKIEIPLQNDSKNYVKSIQEEQFKKLKKNIQSFLEYDEIIKFGNPSGYDRVLFDSFSTVNVVEDAPNLGNYVSGSLPTPGGTTLAQSKSAYPETWKLLETYVGFSTIPKLRYSDNGSYITDFFIDGNIIFNENSVPYLAPLIKIYATKKYNTPNYNWSRFITDLNQFLNDNQTDIDTTLNFIFTSLRKELPNITESKQESTKKSAVQSEVLPLQLWDSFKAFNDQWIAGFDFNQKCLMDDVLIIDRGSRNVGDKHYFDPLKVKKTLTDFVSSGFNNVYELLFQLANDHNFNCSLRSSYSNFYGVYEPDKNAVPKTEGTLEFGNEIFGVFENVDTRKTGPKLVFVMRYNASTHLTSDKAPDVKFKSDAWEFKRVSELPILDDLINKKDWAISNKVVAFNVDAGIRNQNIFKNISVGQDAAKQTIEALMTNRRQVEGMAGNQFASQNISLWDYYNYRSYNCEVTSMGNAMIQPEMYFNLRHIPMFTGPYLINQVTHNIRPGTFETKFKGTRQQMFTYPEIDNFLQNIIKDLFKTLKDKIQQKQNKLTASTDFTLVVVEEQSVNSQVDNKDGCKTSLKQRYQSFIPATQRQTSMTPNELAKLLKQNITDPKLRFAIFTTIYLYSYSNNQFTAFNNNFCGAKLTLNWGDTPTSLLDKEYLCLTNNNNNLPFAIFKDKISMVNFTKSRLSNFMSLIDETSDQTRVDSMSKVYVLYWNTDPQPQSYYNNLVANSPQTITNLKNKITQALNLAKTLNLL
jgi:hypothetical protein